MKRSVLYFAAPGRVEIREEETPAPGPGEVLVETILSAISPGTEMLAYRGQIPEQMAVDETISALGGSFRYPFQYGYSSVGRVIQLGEGVEDVWLGRCAFAFQPHQSHFTAAVGDLLPLPDGMPPERAVFLPNMETAVNFVMDGRPMIGEAVGIFGLGIVGLLTTALLAEYPLGMLAAWDGIARRREEAERLGVQVCLEPGQGVEPAMERLKNRSVEGFDLIYELSGSPAALDLAIRAVGYAGRVVIGSWYGSKRADLDLGGRFHRSRVQILASQVSTIAPELLGRWTKARRMDAAWQALERIRPERWITQRVPFALAADVYRLIAEQPEQTIQVILTY